MKIEVKEIIENEDGSATIEMEVDAEANKIILEKFFTDALTKIAKKDEK